MEDKVVLKKGFFKKLWYSITNIDKYPEMSAEGVKRAITYLMKIIVILSLVVCFGVIYQIEEFVKEGTRYLENEFPDIIYKDGQLNINSEETMTLVNEDLNIDKIIIDTKDIEQEQINQYKNSIETNQTGIIILKDKIILKNLLPSGEVTYEYKDILGQSGMTEFTKQDIIDYARSSDRYTMYSGLFVSMFIYIWILYTLSTLTDALILSALGYITTIIARLKMRFPAIFNMAVYSLTLSLILNIIYIAVNIFIDFNITYFQVMYTSVAYIYLVAAIFIIKSEFMKKQAELMKIIEEQEKVKQENRTEEPQEPQEPKEEEKQEKPKEEEKDNNIGEEPKGEEA